MRFRLFIYFLIPQKMSSCACRRWGPGTTCERPVNTENSRELETKMKQIMAERERQSTFWTAESNAPSNAPIQTMPQKIPVSPSISETKNEPVVREPPQQLRFWN
jgi:hypothetical protein